ncbi:hypothetical protein EUGRSUZ_G02576 [Eucalyptus grandis]|uniref:Uncharacterized protein n=2 Tax=Eucalyptus grandis TaxID=71139 RepID=A0ACC3K7G3_EUCGR|nr:hypothetical protein EUGRSUZ_G02576 [Eucalyptus grandis]
MAQPPPTKPRRTRTRAAWFSGCFGPRRSDEAAQFKTRSNGGGGERLKFSWSYWSPVRFKKSASKTVPVENSAAAAAAAALVSSTVETEKKEANDRFNNPPPKSKSKSKTKTKPKPKRDRDSSKSRPAKQEATAVAETATAPPGQPPESEGDRETIEAEAEAHRTDARENRADAARGNTWHGQKRLSFCRKIDAIRAGSSQPGSPDVKSAKSSRAAAAAIPHSASLPILDPPEPPAPAPPPPAAAPRPAQPPPKPRRARPPRLDSVVGMSIIMVTLVIMILWGRLCAILCTAVWFYFIPQLRWWLASERPVKGDGPDPDLNSEEHKKRVVLEGLLERPRRSSP